MRVLDLGSGKGATSVFLARELDVEVWAADLWIRSEVAEQWRQQWTLGGLVEVTAARLQRDGWADWLRWAHAVRATGNAAVQPSIDMLEADQGEQLSFAIVAARKP